MIQKHKCLAGCGTSITWRFALCTKCEKIYGSKPENWEPWLRFLWQDVLRERRQAKKQSQYEINLDIDEISDIVSGED